MFNFSYGKYLADMFKTRASSSDSKQDMLLRELRLRQDTRWTLFTVLILTIFALVVVGIAQCQLAPSNHAAAIQSPDLSEKPDAGATTQASTATSQNSSTISISPTSTPMNSLRTAPSSEPSNGSPLASTQASREPGDQSHHTSGVALALLWSIAFYVVGSLIGFLFGIPRIAQSAAASDDTKKSSPSNITPNTNLEQISDWLTKIIVGVSLVESRKIMDQTYLLAKFMANSANGIASQAFALAIMITFVIQGFFMGYLATRMFLSSVFYMADGMLGLPPSQTPALNNAIVAPTAAAPDAPPVDDNARREARAVVNSTTTPNLSDPFEDRYQRAKSLLVLGNFAQAALEYSSLVAEKPTDLKLRRERLWALFKRGPQWSSEISGIVKAIDDLRLSAPPADAPDVYLTLTFHYLYAETQEAAQRIIDLADEYEKKRNPPVAGMYINLACAYGQIAKTNSNNATIFDSVQKFAADALAKALARNPSAITRIRMLMVPTNPDNDLAPFAAPGSPVQSVLANPPPPETHGT